MTLKIYLFIYKILLIYLNNIHKVSCDAKAQFNSQEQINSNPYYNVNENLANQYNYQNAVSYYQPNTYQSQNMPTEAYNPSTRYDPSSNDYYRNSVRFNSPSSSYPNDPNRLAYTTPTSVSYIPSNEILSLLTNLEVLGSQQCSANVYSQWEYETNVNDITQLGAVSKLVIEAFWSFSPLFRFIVLFLFLTILKLTICQPSGP